MTELEELDKGIKNLSVELIDKYIYALENNLEV
jgi:hypothetical protein